MALRQFIILLNVMLQIYLTVCAPGQLVPNQANELIGEGLDALFQNIVDTKAAPDSWKITLLKKGELDISHWKSGNVAAFDALIAERKMKALQSINKFIELPNCRIHAYITIGSLLAKLKNARQENQESNVAIEELINRGKLALKQDPQDNTMDSYHPPQSEQEEAKYSNDVYNLTKFFERFQTIVQVESLKHDCVLISSISPANMTKLRNANNILSLLRISPFHSESFEALSKLAGTTNENVSQLLRSIISNFKNCKSHNQQGKLDLSDRLSANTFQLAIVYIRSQVSEFTCSNIDIDHLYDIFVSLSNLERAAHGSQGDSVLVHSLATQVTVEIEKHLENKGNIPKLESEHSVTAAIQQKRKDVAAMIDSYKKNSIESLHPTTCSGNFTPAQQKSEIIKNIDQFLMTTFYELLTSLANQPQNNPFSEVFEDKNLFYYRTLLQHSLNTDIEILQNCSTPDITKIVETLKQDGTLKSAFDNLVKRKKLAAQSQVFDSSPLLKPFERPQYKKHQLATMAELYEQFQNLERIKKEQAACFFIAPFTELAMDWKYAQHDIVASQTNEADQNRFKKDFEAKGSDLLKTATTSIFISKMVAISGYEIPHTFEDFKQDLINAQAFMTNFSSKVRSHVFMIDGQFNLRVPISGGSIFFLYVVENILNGISTIDTLYNTEIYLQTRIQIEKTLQQAREFLETYGKLFESEVLHLKSPRDELDQNAIKPLITKENVAAFALYSSFVRQELVGHVCSNAGIVNESFEKRFQHLKAIRAKFMTIIQGEQTPEAILLKSTQQDEQYITNAMAKRPAGEPPKYPEQTGHRSVVDNKVDYEVTSVAMKGFALKNQFLTIIYRTDRHLVSRQAMDEVISSLKYVVHVPHKKDICSKGSNLLLETQRDLLTNEFMKNQTFTYQAPKVQEELEYDIFEIKRFLQEFKRDMANLQLEPGQQYVPHSEQTLNLTNKKILDFLEHMVEQMVAVRERTPNQMLTALQAELHTVKTSFKEYLHKYGSVVQQILQKEGNKNEHYEFAIATYAASVQQAAIDFSCLEDSSITLQIAEQVFQHVGALYQIVDKSIYPEFFADIENMGNLIVFKLFANSTSRSNNAEFLQLLSRSAFFLNMPMPNSALFKDLQNICVQSTISNVAAPVNPRKEHLKTFLSFLSAALEKAGHQGPALAQIARNLTALEKC